MPLLRSNLHRVLFKDTIFRYAVHTSGDNSCGEQLEQFLQEIDRSVVFNSQNFQMYLPYEWPHEPQYSLMLLKGEQIKITILPSRIDSPANDRMKVIQLLLRRLIINTKFLYCDLLMAGHNPFEEKQFDDITETPGFSLNAYRQGETDALFIKPNVLIVDHRSNVSQTGQIFMDLLSGRFVLKSEVVRVEKKQDQTLIHFRDKSVFKKEFLKLAWVKPVVGYEMAIATKKYIQRIQNTSSEFMKIWNFIIDWKPMDFNVHFVDPGFIKLGNAEKPLNNMVFPVSRNSYNNYYKMNFDVPFDAFPEVDIIICCKQKSQKIQKFKTVLEQIRDRMSLKMTVTIVIVEPNTPQGWKSFLYSQLICTGKNIYLICQPEDNSKDFEFMMKESLIRQLVLFQFFRQSQLSNTDVNQNQVTCLQHLAVICSKFRLAPWKLKSLPFGEFPFSVISLSVEKKKNGNFSIGYCFTLNAYLSKFYNQIAETQEDHIEDIISELVIRSLQRFSIVHKIYPMRLFVFRWGHHVFPINKEYDILKNKIRSFYNQVGNTKINHLIQSNLQQDKTDLRLYFQVDQTNQVINPETVKPAGLLTCLQFDNKIFLQLKYSGPPTQLDVYHEENNYPNFSKKIQELVCRLAFGSVGGKYGGGLGFLGFSKRLNSYRQYDLTYWKKYLQEGNMMFL